jgi:hypothetical protein
MKCLRILCLMLTGALLGLAQRTMTVADLLNFVRSSVNRHNQDREVADVISKLKLTERLDLRLVEELQSSGAGPKTLAALRKLSLDSAALTPPAPPATQSAYVGPPAPSSTEQHAILDEITEHALNYTENLPNFICTQIVRRHIDPSGTGSYSLDDTILEQLTFFDKKETYKVSMVNNRAVTNTDHNKLGGATSSGEFGSMLREVFDRNSHTSFDWAKWATLRGKRMYVFNFKIEQQYSKYSIYHEPSGRRIVSGYHGLIYADAETKQVMKITMDCDTIPADFPIQDVDLALDYDVQAVGEQAHLLPLKSEMHSREGKNLSWNETEFRAYRKFGTESSITFDTSLDPIPEDQLKEQPVKPDTAAPPSAGKKR